MKGGGGGGGAFSPSAKFSFDGIIFTFRVYKQILNIKLKM